MHNAIAVSRQVRVSTPRKSSRRPATRRSPGAAIPLPDQVALLLQGGGALGSYQAGVYAALCELGIDVDWVAGISIGAVNAALIAGNPPERRVGALREFWDGVSSAIPDLNVFPGQHIRETTHLWAAATVAMTGVPGFFTPRLLPAYFAADGSSEAISYYDTAPLAETLDRLVDWDLLNHGEVRFSAGAVDVERGNFEYFDNRSKRWKGRIDARHILASGALPPGFAPVEIDGRHYWDGGLVSNTPLQHVLDHQRGDMLAFQVDLFPAEGPFPQTMTDAWSREKDIRYSSRTRMVTDRFVRTRKEHEAIRSLLARLPEAALKEPEVAEIAAMVDDGAVNIVHLIYRTREWESGARDFEFSYATMTDHWKQGEEDVAKSMRNGDILARNIIDGRTASFDLDDDTLTEKNTPITGAPE